MFVKRNLATMVLIAIIIMSVPLTASAIKVDFTAQDGTKVEATSSDDVWQDDMIICPDTSKKLSNNFEAFFALRYGIYHGKINVNFYSDSKKVVFEDSDGALPQIIRKSYEKWVLSDEYASWLAGKKDFEHIAANPVQGVEGGISNEFCWLYMGCDRGYYIVTYYHYDSKQSQKPSRVYQKQMSYCASCGSFEFDYLNRVDIDKINSNEENIPNLTGKELKDYTEDEMYKYLRSHFSNVLSNPLLPELVKTWAKERLTALNNHKLVYIVDSKNRLAVTINGMKNMQWLEKDMELITKNIENRGKTVASSNYESVVKKFAN